MESIMARTLNLLIVLEICSPVLILVLILTLRLYMLTTHLIPGFVERLNRAFNPAERFNPPEVNGGLLYVCLFLFYPIAKFIMALKFWEIAKNKESGKADGFKWILTTILLTVVGTFLIFPLQTHGVPETAPAIIFLIINSVISVASFLYLIVHIYLNKSSNSTTTMRNPTDSPLLTTKI